MIASQVAGANRPYSEPRPRNVAAKHTWRTVINSAPIALLAFDGSGCITFSRWPGLDALGAKPASTSANW